jgi:hypothetical protein
MRRARAALLLIAVVAFAAYGSDCLTMATLEQAMECCNSMPCAPDSHHGQHCCKAMSAIHAPFVQAQPKHVVTVVQLGAVPTSELAQTAGICATGVSIARYGHAPPPAHSHASPPIRI